MGIQIIGAGGTIAEVDPYKKALRVSQIARGASYSLVGQTGTMAAALGANSSIWAVRLDASAGATYKVYIDRLRVEWRTLTAFTTPITEGRRIALFRGSGAAPSGGTTIIPVKKDSADGVSQIANTEGGAAHIATTAALTVAGITFEADPIRIFPLEHNGAAAAREERIWEFDPGSASGAQVLNQGEVLAIRNPAAMDAAGTFKLTVTIDYHEGTI